MIIAPICMSCKHYDRKADTFRCAAFELIPDAIIESTEDHRQPIDGDGGIVFEQDPAQPEPSDELLEILNTG